MMSTPLSIIDSAQDKTPSVLSKRPPSEKESGVKLSIPITKGLLSGRVNLPHFSL